MKASFNVLSWWKPEDIDMTALAPVLTALAAIGLLIFTARWINRRFGFTVTLPPPPPRTPEEIQWERERRTLKLCLRHPYC